MNYTLLTWYEQEYLKCKAHFEALSYSTVFFASRRIESLITKILPVCHAGRYTSS